MSEAIGVRTLITSGAGIPTRGAYMGSTDQDQYWWTEDQAIRISPVLTYPWTVLVRSSTVYEHVRTGCGVIITDELRCGYSSPI